ncbi:MAG: hypothetical protein WCG27_11460 [Pseudomonadota bacterium]
MKKLGERSTINDWVKKKAKDERPFNCVDESDWQHFMANFVLIKVQESFSEKISTCPKVEQEIEVAYSGNLMEGQVVYVELDRSGDECSSLTRISKIKK